MGTSKREVTLSRFALARTVPCIQYARAMSKHDFFTSDLRRILCDAKYIQSTKKHVRDVTNHIADMTEQDAEVTSVDVTCYD